MVAYKPLILPEMCILTSFDKVRFIRGYAVVYIMGYLTLWVVLKLK